MRAPDQRRLAPAAPPGQVTRAGAPGPHAADDLPDGHDEEQLPGHCLKDGERLPGIGGGHQVPVSDGGHRDEAEEQVLAERAVPRRAEERHASELAGRLVGEGEEHADQQVGGDGPEQYLGVDLAPHYQMAHAG
jgi:hypothetical protein